ncbi:extracellular superoxide dismutase [Cu-Zn] [Denticeps clupeoides]|uniref:extracellular superoxide dismutase [Cu-Zn] n=1 Tax=Denticeps clupeoides TaxID=299321 RepID=UPI0010A554D6|nr:extracellular superoxide dismutase [Cu-Zn] [Denticeps clupeoides]
METRLQNILPVLIVLMHCQKVASCTEVPMEVTEFNGTLYAACEVAPDSALPQDQPKIYGQILFKQAFPHGQLQIIINLHGLPSVEDKLRAIHIHRYGHLSDGFLTAGPHYNPKGSYHPDHPGDLGNFNSRDGKIRVFLKSSKGTLFGGESFLGRSALVHEREDDLGQGGNDESLRSGNAGRRIAGCVIGLCSPTPWDEAVEPWAQEGHAD